MPQSSRGSLWNRWDLHFHTPTSHDYQNNGVTNQQIVEGLIEAHVRVVAVTDHHTIDLGRIRELQKLGSGKLTVLPGIELRSELGGRDFIHFIGIFPEDCDLQDVWTKLSASCRITPADIAKKGHDKVYCDLEDSARVIHKLGGVVTIHGHGKANSIEGIANKPEFKAQLKTDILRDSVDILEIGVAERQRDYKEKVFPDVGFLRPLVVGSDNHDITKYAPRSACWIRATPNFRGLLMMLQEPFDRVCLEDKPPELIRVEQSPTKYIRSISFQRKAEVATTERWFSGRVEFNHGLVAIIGNKGSGKSALADTIGLLGAAKNENSFSFLTDKRFRHAAGGRAALFEATIEWESNETKTLCLADSVKPEEIERVRYLPQEYVERVCNELAEIGEKGFESEIKSVIFSHVPEPERLGHRTLDDLVQFQTGEKQNRIDTLAKQLKECSRLRANLEQQADPVAKAELLAKIEQRKRELDAHDKAKPVEVPSPTGTLDTNAQEALDRLLGLEADKKKIHEAVAEANDKLASAQRRHAVAELLVERLSNFQKEVDSFKASLTKEATELSISVNDLVGVTINKDIPSLIHTTESSAIAGFNELLNAEAGGLLPQLGKLDVEIEELRLQLDAPHRAHKEYQTAQAAWADKRRRIEGDEIEAESLIGLQKTLEGLEQLPEKIATQKEKQVSLAVEIYAEKLAQAAIYRTLYGTVQKFVDSHVLKDKLRLEFRAELVCIDFSKRFLELLERRKRGSFMGIDEGRERAESYVQAANWSDADSLKAFLEKVDKALHEDQRGESPTVVQIKDQVARITRPAEVFDLLYSLDYLQPRYILRWEGKDLSMLSPGERGTLLLVFYLLIDKGDTPLILDQPEGNLDNHTVAKVLVDCIKEARTRRQVFIVTHNPNLAVVCDASQVIHANIDKMAGNQVTYESGALEEAHMSKYVTDVLEGTRWAFGVRGEKYDVGEARAALQSAGAVK